MKNNIKSFIAGALVTMVFVMSFNPVLARNLSKSVEVVYRDIKIYVDDKKINPSDTNGNIVEPFIYNGTTYLPVRAIGEAFGKPVEWEGTTSTIYVGTHSDEKPDLSITSTTPYFTSNTNASECDFIKFVPSRHKDNKGEMYDSALVASGRYSIWGDSQRINRSYLLNAGYSKLSGKFGLTYNSRNITTNNVSFIVRGDNKVLYTSDAITCGDLPIDFEIDVTGVIELNIMFVFSDSEDAPTTMHENDVALFDLNLFH